MAILNITIFFFTIKVTTSPKINLIKILIIHHISTQYPALKRKHIGQRYIIY